jgi:hypothetical protein
MSLACRRKAEPRIIFYMSSGLFPYIMNRHSALVKPSTDLFLVARVNTGGPIEKSFLKKQGEF